MQNKIMPSLWFSATGCELSAILAYYKGIFGDEFEPGAVTDLGESPSGKTSFCQVHLFGQRYSFLATEMDHVSFNDAFSLTLFCEDQAEIDYYWHAFTEEGQEVQCGWCHDKFGLRFQVIPKNLDALLSKPNAWNIMMGQKKIVIADYL